MSCLTQKCNFWKRPSTDFDKNYIFGIGTSSAIEWYLSFLLSISWPSDEPWGRDESARNPIAANVKFGDDCANAQKGLSQWTALIRSFQTGVRRSRFNRSALMCAYFSDVRSILEYGCVIWAGAVDTHTVRIDRVQHKFLIWLLSNTSGHTTSSGVRWSAVSLSAAISGFPSSPTWSALHQEYISLKTRLPHSPGQFLPACTHSINPHSTAVLRAPSTCEHGETGVVHQGTPASKLIFTQRSRRELLYRLLWNF